MDELVQHVLNMTKEANIARGDSAAFLKYMNEHHADAFKLHTLHDEYDAEHHANAIRSAPTDETRKQAIQAWQWWTWSRTPYGQAAVNNAALWARVFDDVRIVQGGQATSAPEWLHGDLS